MVFGGKASLSWLKEEPNEFVHTSFTAVPKSSSAVPAIWRLLQTSMPALGGDASPLGKQGTVGDRTGIQTAHDGVKGFAFVDAVINNSESNSVWRRRSRHSPEIPVGYPMRLLDSIFPWPLEWACS